MQRRSAMKLIGLSTIAPTIGVEVLSRVNRAETTEPLRFKGLAVRYGPTEISNNALIKLKQRGFSAPPQITEDELIKIINKMPETPNINIKGHAYR